MSGVRRYALIGKPVKHSLSPGIHAQFAAEFGLPIEYGLLEPMDEGFVGAAREFLAGGACGMNVTLPYKEQALEFATDVSHGARLAGAANTLKRGDDGTVSACNTDGAGLLVDLKRRHRQQLAGKSILVLGAGGAAAGVMAPLLNERPVSLCVANRTVKRAEELAARFLPHAGDVKLVAAGLDEVAAQGSFEVVIHATSSGYGNGRHAWQARMFAATTLAYDLSYGAAARAFLAAARDAGVAVVADGLGMLVEQAALSFAFWEARMPATDVVYADLVGAC